HIDAVLAGENQRFEANYGLKHGTRIQYALTEYIPDWVDGEVAGFYIIAFDITDMKHAKAALAAGEDKLDGLFKLSRLGIVLNDMQGRFLEFNHAFTKLTGYSADTLRKLDYWTLTPGDYQDQETVQLDLLKEHGHYGPYEKEYLRADGVRIPVLLNGVLIHDANDQPLIWSIVEDITERKAMDSELRKAKESAENLAVAKSDFLANMSHEIRTPMNAISGLCQLALNLDVSSEVRDYLEKMAGASRGLLEILNDVLDFSKLESGKFHIKSDPFRLDELLGEINDIFVEVAARKKLSFHVRTDSSTPVALIGDAGRLRQIIANLVSNAIKFTTDGRVTLSVAPLSNTGDRAVIRFKVSDSGIGIAEEDIPKLFDPFIQVEAAHRNANGGTGLGLAISSELLALMGSHFDVSSIIGLGSSFSFDLDLLQNRSRAPSTGDAGQIQGNSRNTRAGELKMELEQIGSDIRGKRILIAEDNVISQMLMREFLAFAQLRVELAGDGVEALAALDRNTYDAVLMDMHMPRMGGIEATRQIRMNPRYRQLPVIALSAGVTEEEREICLEAGVDAFIAKPVDPKALLQVLIRLIKK
ncbi:MAG: hypothetical protein RIQ52_188, partial [Pseudomonadota bacterium]